MSAKFVSKSTVAAAAVSGIIAFGIGMAVPSGIAAAEPPGCVESAGLTAFGLPLEPESISSCESERDTCLAMHRKEDVWGNPYIPADDYSTCMKGYWYCKNNQG
ncbi:hypothetical protein [Mycobacterium sp. TY815]|uniref:hypothetical protein n=1 Tax=Mycobacterium sp. TY815 TaxID=3050581 RepID=UPI0027406AE2|nr:hypothetical protein [Mycobacterium sp. TY815]MDP7705735.1 hypothetical protein [Mycobacterium sp. TY815]